jgi:hypothetical protein
MEKLTKEPEFTITDKSIPTGIVQEPLTQSDLVSESQVDQYKNQKQAQINATLHSQATPFSPSYKSQPVHRYTPPTSSTSSSSNPHIFPLMRVLIGFLVIGVIGIFIGSQIIPALPAATGALAASQQSIINTISMGVSACEIMVVVACASILLEFSKILTL